jgi:hypothetical protein
MAVIGIVLVGPSVGVPDRAEGGAGDRLNANLPAVFTTTSEA